MELIDIMGKAMEVSGKLIKITQSLQSNPDKSRGGGVLTLTKMYETIITDIEQISVGDFNTNKLKKYQECSAAKLYSLFAYILLHPEEDIFSSCQIPIINGEALGGGIISKKFYGSRHGISMSGLNSQTDSAVSIITGNILNLLINDEYVQKAIKLTQNPVMPELLEEAIKQGLYK